MTITEAMLSRAIELAAVKAAELTGSKIAEQVAKELSGEVLFGNPVSPHCERVLEKPPSCVDFRGVRSWILCRSWERMEKERLPTLPVGESWREVRKLCQRS